MEAFNARNKKWMMKDMKDVTSDEERKEEKALVERVDAILSEIFVSEEKERVFQLLEELLSVSDNYQKLERCFNYPSFYRKMLELAKKGFFEQILIIISKIIENCSWCKHAFIMSKFTNNLISLINEENQKIIFDFVLKNCETFDEIKENILQTSFLIDATNYALQETDYELLNQICCFEEFTKNEAFKSITDNEEVFNHIIEQLDKKEACSVLTVLTKQSDQACANAVNYVDQILSTLEEEVYSYPLFYVLINIISIKDQVPEEINAQITSALQLANKALENGVNMEARIAAIDFISTVFQTMNIELILENMNDEILASIIDFMVIEEEEPMKTLLTGITCFLLKCTSCDEDTRERIKSSFITEEFEETIDEIESSNSATLSGMSTNIKSVINMMKQT